MITEVDNKEVKTVGPPISPHESKIDTPVSLSLSMLLRLSLQVCTYLR